MQKIDKSSGTKTTIFKRIRRCSKVPVADLPALGCFGIQYSVGESVSENLREVPQSKQCNVVRDGTSCGQQLQPTAHFECHLQTSLHQTICIHLRALPCLLPETHNIRHINNGSASL